jgi:hypothetical protein
MDAFASVKHYVSSLGLFLISAAFLGSCSAPATADVERSAIDSVARKYGVKSDDLRVISSIVGDGWGDGVEYTAQLKEICKSTDASCDDGVIYVAEMSFEKNDRRWNLLSVNSCIHHGQKNPLTAAEARCAK